MRRTALLVFSMLLAACGGQRIEGDRPGFPSLGTSAVAVDAPEPVVFDQPILSNLVVADHDLPTGFRHLIVSSPHRVTIGEPAFFATGDWVIGRASTYRPAVPGSGSVDLPGLREEEITITSGTSVAGTVAGAADVFADGVDAAGSAPDVEVTEIELGEEAVLLEITGPDRHERQVILRRHNVLAAVIAGGSGAEGLPDAAAMLAMAERLDTKLAAAIAGEPEATGGTGLSTSPALQLDSFEFTFSSSYVLVGGTTRVVSTGRFQAPDMQACDVVVGGGETVSLLGDSGGLAVPDTRGYRYLDDQLGASFGPICLGSSEFFDLTAEMFDESAYIAVVDGVPSWTVETINGTSTRRYSLDSSIVAGLFGSAAPERFDIWFDAADGWPVRLDYGGFFPTEGVLGPSVMSSQDTVETSIRIDITRPNDPAIVVAVPDDILPAGGMSS